MAVEPLVPEDVVKAIRNVVNDPNDSIFTVYLGKLIARELIKGSSQECHELAARLEQANNGLVGQSVSLFVSTLSEMCLEAGRIKQEETIAAVPVRDIGKRGIQPTPGAKPEHDNHR